MSRIIFVVSHICCLLLHYSIYIFHQGLKYCTIHSELVVELLRSADGEYLIITQNREITPGCCSSHSLLESHFMSTLFHSQFLLTTGSLQNNFIFVVCQLFTLPPPILADWSRLTARKNKYQKERVNLASHFYGLNKI